MVIAWLMRVACIGWCGNMMVLKEESDKELIFEKLLSAARGLIAEAESIGHRYISNTSALHDIHQLATSLLSRADSAPEEGNEIASPDLSRDCLRQSTADDVENCSLRQTYYDNWASTHWLTENRAQLMAERMITRWKQSPSFALFMIVSGRDDVDKAKKTIESLSLQLYKRFTITVISDIEQHISDLNSYDNVTWIVSQDHCFTLNQAAINTDADWLALIKAGDCVAHHGLFTIADYDNLKAERWRLIYSDEDFIDEEGERNTPLFKPDINLEYLRSYPYIGRFCFIRKSLFLALGGYRQVDGAYNEELVLRTLERFDESVVGHIADVLFHRSSVCSDPLEHIEENQWRQIIADHLKRGDIDANVADGYLPKTNRVIYSYSGQPSVSVIIPTKNRPDLIEPCVTSLLEKTNYPNYEVIIVDNGSDSEDVFYYYGQWQKHYPERIKILSYDKPFNFSAMNNYAVREANGDYLILLNNDTEVINGAWMERMLAHAQRPDVGVVGARLLFPDGIIQHAGVIMGMADSASHAGIGEDFHKPGYMGRYQVDQNFNAVTAACFMTKKSVYNEIFGLDEDLFKVLFNDVDYCLKAREKGYKVVWTPYATLVHKHSASLKEKKSEAEFERCKHELGNLLSRWSSYVKNDSAFNQNLSLRKSNYMPDTMYSPAWNNDFVMRPKILALPQDHFGCGNYRIIGPLNALADASKAEIHIGPRQDIYQGSIAPIATITEVLRAEPDVIFMQAMLQDEHIYSVEFYKKFSGVPLMADIDDLKTDLPDKNCNKRFVAKDVRSRLRKFLSFIDQLTVSTQPLAEAYKHLIDNIVVVPNRIDATLWGDLSSQRRTSAKPRVGWVGAQQHHGDLEVIIDVVKQTAKEVDWIFMGMCLDELKPYIKEEHQFVGFADYPAKMASLNLDLAVAPLELNAFNEAKSNLRILEYGALGWPVVCTDIYPYQNAPVARVKNTTADWLAAIRDRIYDLDIAAKEGDALRAWVKQHWILQDHLDDWAQPLLGDSLSGAAMPRQKTA